MEEMNSRNLDSYEKAYKLICMKLNVDCLKAEQLMTLHQWFISSPQLFSIFENSNSKILYSSKYLSCDKDIVKFLVKESRKSSIYYDFLYVVPKDSTLESLAIEFDLNWSGIHG